MATVLPRVRAENRTAITIVNKTIGLFDDKGREVGYRVKLFETDFVLVGDDEAAYRRGTPGHKFAASVNVTRGEVTYGATQPSRYFNTAKEREDCVQDLIVNLVKRQTKKWSERK